MMHGYPFGGSGGNTSGRSTNWLPQPELWEGEAYVSAMEEIHEEAWGGRERSGRGPSSTRAILHRVSMLDVRRAAEEDTGSEVRRVPASRSRPYNSAAAGRYAARKAHLRRLALLAVP
jgi:hypothetical protein